MQKIVFLILLAFFVFSSAENSEEVNKCESKFCEEDENYPEKILNSLELWKYKFDPEPKSLKEKRSINPDSDSYLIEAKLCDSRISFNRPQKLKNANEKWRTVVNHRNYTQFVRMEICNSANFPCTFNIYPSSVRSFCHQNYKTVELLAFDDHKNCLVAEKFNVPSSCACAIDKEDLLKGVKQDLLQRP